MRLPDGQQADDERLTRLDVDGQFLARLGALEKRWRGEDADVAMLGAVLGEILEDARIEEPGKNLPMRRRESRDLGHRLPGCLEVGRRERFAGAPCDEVAGADDPPHDRLGESTRRLAHPPRQQIDDRLGEGHLAGIGEEIAGMEAVGHQEEGQIADGLARRRHLDDVAEERVDVGIGPADILPAVAKPEGLRLLEEVRELPPWHLVEVEIGVGGLHSAFEGGVVLADGRPVAGQMPQRLGVEAGVERGVTGRLHQRIEIRLARQPGEGRHRRVDNARAVAGCLELAGQRRGGGVVGVEVDRDPNRLTERLDEGRGGVGLAQPGHILDRKHVSAALLELPGELDVVGQGELCPGRIEDVAGVADRRLADPAGVADGIHGHLHVRHPIERVEHPEEVDPSGRGLLHEGRDDVVGVVGVADGIAGPEEHLEEDVRNPFPEAGEAVPGIFFEEPHRGVEGRAPPHLEREQPRGHPGVGIGDRKHVEGAHPGGEERLMRIAHRRVGHHQPLVVADPGSKLFRAELLEPRLRSRRWRREPVKLGNRRGGAPGRCRPPLHERIAVDDRVGEVFEEPGGPVAADGEVKQRRRVVDEPRRATAGEELGVGDEIDQKRDVRLHATDAELLQAAFDVAGRLVERQSPRRHLHQK